MIRPRIQTSSKFKRASTAVDRVFQLLVAIVIVGVVYRYCWIDVSDPFKCRALLNKGEWLDPGPRWSSRNPFQNWQPPGCIMHEYEKKDIQECFGRKRLVFVGDSTTRQIYWAVTKKMDLARAQDEARSMLDQEQKHRDLEFISEGVTVEFIWDPWLNSSGLDHELRRFHADPGANTDGGADDSAGLLLLGAPGLWYARHGQENHAKGFRDAIDRVIPYMDHMPEDDSSSPIPRSEIAPRSFRSRPEPKNLLLLAPIQVPKYQSLSPSREETITPEKIDNMNDYLQQVSAHSKADVVWSYSLMTWNTVGAYEESGLHVVNNVAHRKADVLLNLRCNAAAAARGYPFDRTCCTNYRKPGGIQWIMIVSGMLLCPGLYFLRRRQFVRVGRFLPNSATLTALSVFALVICFCFYADRTQIFEKSQRQFRRREFLAACLVAGAAGFVSIRRSKSPTQSGKASTSSEDNGFLSREQTEEWKGWMQFIVLIYHYTHGSKVLWIYEIIRLLVASYLFMTGFGHTMYFLRRGDYSLKRVARVLVRLNLLSITLPYMMRTDYLFYYFAPLVSFWFCVIYATMRIGRSRNSKLGFLITKILLSAILTTSFTMTPGILEFISSMLKSTCAISWNLTEWRFRIFLDMYIVYVGMVVAILCNRLSQLNTGVIPTSRLDKILKFTITYKYLFKITLILVSLVLLPGFWALTRRSPDKQDYNWWHPFISFIPVVSFIILRNSNRTFRNYHSNIFAWLGRCSLETYVLQFHIWLAGDTKGLLRLGLWNRWVEAAMLTAVFLWASRSTANATQTLTEWIVSTPNDRRNFGAIGDDMKSSQYLSPLMQPDEMTPATPSKDIRSEIGGPKWLDRWILKVRDDLRWRICLILVTLWLGNICYT